MSLNALFDRFSRRNRSLIDAQPEITAVPRDFRNRVLMQMNYFHQCANAAGWEFVRHQIELQKAIPLKSHSTSHSFGPIFTYLSEAEGSDFWEALEVVLSYHGHSIREMTGSSRYSIYDEPRVPGWQDLHNAISDVNEFLKESAIPYNLVMSDGVSRFEIVGTDFERHALMEPATELFNNPMLKTAEEDFRSALQAYRSGRYNDCAIRCGTTIEAVLKAMCKEKAISYNPNDVGVGLYQKVEAGLGLRKDLKNGLTGVFQLRNPASHGRGVEDRKATQQEAHLALCLTASSALYLAEVAGMHTTPNYGLGFQEE